MARPHDAWISHPDTPVKGDPIDIYDPTMRELSPPTATTTRTTTSTLNRQPKRN